MNSHAQILSADTRKLQINHIPKILTLLLVLTIPISTSVSNVLVFCIMLSWFLLGDLKSKVMITFQYPITRVALLLFGLFLFGTFYSDAPWQDIHDTLRRMAKLLFIPFLIPLFQEAKWRRWALWAFVSVMMLTLVLSFFKVYGGLSIATRHTEACVFKNHIETNLMMGLAAFILGHLALEARPWIRYLCFGIILVMTFYVLGLSEGRTGYVIFIGLWLLFLLQRFSFKFVLCGALLLASILGTVALKSEYFQDRIGQLSASIVKYSNGDSEVTSFSERVEYFKESLTLFKQHPWQGSGTGSFKTVYQDHALKNNLMTTQNPHNEYLNIAVQLGVLGLFGFLVFFWTMFRTSLQCTGLERYVVQGLILAMVIGCFANAWLMDFTPGYLFVILLGICVGGCQKSKSHA